MKQLTTLFFLLFFSIYSFSQINLGTTTVDTTTLINNLGTPWDISYSSVDSSLWITEREGIVRKYDLASNTLKTVLDYQNQVEQVGESGLLGFELISSTAVPKVYLVYTYRTASNTLFERLSQFSYDLVNDTLLGELILIDSIPAASIHDGSRLEIVGNYLYMTTGDAANTSLAQDLSSLAGKVLRLELNGAIPNDNPIANSYIYSWGHRNAQGLYYANNMLYSSEHGPSTNDEINIIEKGRNYGWPDVEGFCDQSSEMTFCNDSNVYEPLFAWTPTIATSGICYYDHAAIPEWQNSILLTTLKNQRLYQLELDQDHDSITNTTEFFTNYWSRLRDIETNEHGEIFIAANAPGRIIKISNPNFTGIPKEQNPKRGFSFYPNPANHNLNLALPSGENQAKIRLYNVNGEKVFQQEILSANEVIKLNSIKDGIYLLQVELENGQLYERKLVVEQ